jgi:transposase
MSKKQIGVSLKTPYGVIPETFSVPVSITQEQERVIFRLSDIHRMIADQMIIECRYRLALALRKKKAEPIVDGESEYDTRTTAFSLNYILTDLGKHDHFSCLKQIRSEDARGTALYVSGAFDSYFELKKRGDAQARMPRPSSNGMFQTIIWQNVVLRGNSVRLIHMLDGKKQFLDIEIPQMTAKKIGGRDIIHAKIVRKNKCLDDPSGYSIELVCHQPAPEPKVLKRAMGVDIGAGNIAMVDSRGHKTWVHMRRPDKFWMPKILLCDAQLKALRDGRLEQTQQYHDTAKNRRGMFQKMQSQQRDFQRKLAAHVIIMADVFFIGEESIRLGLAQSHDGTAKEHRGVQNTGAMSRFVQYLKWNARKNGKMVVMVPDAHSQHADYKTRKVLAAEAHLKSGLASKDFLTAIVSHGKLLVAGQLVLGNELSEIPKEHLAMSLPSFSQAVGKILEKTTEPVKTVRIDRKPKAFLSHS